LELVTPEGIALSSLTPNPASGELKIEGRSRNFAQVTSYLEKLEESGKFRETLLLSHRELALGERTRGVEFTISCRMVR
jgi:type IV pilus assembly protein PilN